MWQAGKDKEGRDEVHKSTCKCRECYLRKEQALKDRKAGLSVRASAPAKTFSELSRGKAGGAGAGARARGG